MLQDLRDKLDVVGWFNTSDPDYQGVVFRWMQEATLEIERLSREVEDLSAQLAARAA